jgi:hypothetical protein
LREQLALVSQRLEELAAENAELRRAQNESATAIADVKTTVAQAAPVATDNWSEIGSASTAIFATVMSESIRRAVIHDGVTEFARG